MKNSVWMNSASKLLPPHPGPALVDMTVSRFINTGRIGWDEKTQPEIAAHIRACLLGVWDHR